MNMHSTVGSEVVANGRGYARPARPTVVICMDGSEPAYIEAASAKGLSSSTIRAGEKGGDDEQCRGCRSHQQT